MNEVIMAGTVKRKSLNRDKTNAAASSQRSDSVSKPPPFRFGKLSYNEARLLSLERKSRTKLVNPSEGNELSIRGTKQPRGLINTKLRSFQDDTKRAVNGNAKELLRKDFNDVASIKESKSRAIQNGGFCKADSNRPANYLSDYDNDGQLMEKSVATSISAKTHETFIRVPNERQGLEKRPRQGPLRDSNTRNFPNKDQGYIERISTNSGINATNEMTQDFVTCKALDDGASERATNNAETKGPTLKDSFDMKSSNQETGAQTVAQDRLQMKQRKETRSSLVKQKSKRIPTRHIKYVSELDEKVRNKYRKKQAFKPGTDDNKTNAASSTGKENKDAVGCKEPSNCRGFSNGACQKNTTHGPSRKPVLACSSSKVQREGKSEKSCLNVSKTSDRIEYHPSKQTMNGHGGRVKSAPVTRTACRNVESFLVRNGLIPKSSGKPEESKNSTKVSRKKSIRLILSRSRAKSMRKKRIANGVAKQKKDVSSNQNDVDVVSNSAAQVTQHNGHITNGYHPKGRLMNGHVANGHIASRHASNGHFLNGHIPNGPFPNGHIQNGHVTNGSYKVCAYHVLLIQNDMPLCFRLGQFLVHIVEVSPLD